MKLKENLKICAYCHKIKILTEFHKDKNSKDGRYSYCKDCRRIITGSKKANIKIIGEYEGYTVYGSSTYPRITTPNGRKRLHVYIMEKILGRKLNIDECVHHIDGNRYNWDIGNLQLMSSRAHHSLESFKMNKKNGNHCLLLTCKYCGKEKKYSSYYSYKFIQGKYKCAICRSKYKKCT